LYHLQGLASLKLLSLSGTCVTGSGLEAIASAPLTNLEIGGAPHFATTNACLPQFEKLTKLHQLGFYSDKITAAEIAATNWPAELHYVSIGILEIDEEALRSLARCPKLIQIDIRRDSLSSAAETRAEAVLSPQADSDRHPPRQLVFRCRDPRRSRPFRLDHRSNRFGRDYASRRCSASNLSTMNCTARGNMRL
jgi:hypothetical protein